MAPRMLVPIHSFETGRFGEFPENLVWKDRWPALVRGLMAAAFKGALKHGRNLHSNAVWIDEFVNALNKKYFEAASWWRQAGRLTQETFVAIRVYYLNVYYRGNSLLKLEPKLRDKSMVGQVHCKYLLRPNIGASEHVNR